MIYSLEILVCLNILQEMFSDLPRIADIPFQSSMQSLKYNLCLKSTRISRNKLKSARKYRNVVNS